MTAIGESSEDADQFITNAKEPSSARRIATLSSMQLGCGDSITLSATACGGPDAIVVWNSRNLNVLVGGWRCAVYKCCCWQRLCG